MVKVDSEAALSSEYYKMIMSSSRRPKVVIYDDEEFADCNMKHLDIFYVLQSMDTDCNDKEEQEEDWDVTSTSSSSEDSTSLSSPSTIFLDALDMNSSIVNVNRGIHSKADNTDEDDSKRVHEDFTDAIDHEVEWSHQEHGLSLNVDPGTILSHAVHFATDIWEGTKQQTPIGLMIHVTEDIVHHLTGLADNAPLSPPHPSKAVVFEEDLFMDTYSLETGRL